jgi:O-Antigen ligase
MTIKIKHSSALWSILFLLLYTGPPKFRVRDFDASLLGQFDLPVLIQIGVYLFCGIFVARKLIENRHRLRLSATPVIAAVFLLSLASSALISADPKLTLFRTYQFAILFLFSGLFLDEFGISETFRHLIIGNALLCALVVVAVPFIESGILESSETGFPRLRGSAIAETAITGTFLWILLLAQRRMGSKLLLALAAVVTFFSLSRVSWGTSFFAMLLIVVFKPKVWSVWLSRIVCIVAVVALLAVGLERLTGTFRDPTIEDYSGRTEIWTYTTGIVLTESPWLGLGYGVASRTLVADINPTLGSAHSVFVDVFAGGGFIALSAFLLLNVMMGIDAAWIFFKRKEANAFLVATLFISFFLMSTVGGELDSAPFGFTFFSLIWMLPLVRSADASEVTTDSAILSSRAPRTDQGRPARPSLPPVAPTDAESSGN